MIGELRHRIKFLAKLQGRDPKTGAEIKTIIESSEVWAHVEFTEVGSTERMESDKLTAMTAAKFTIRYKQGITTEMEILHDGLHYKILSLLPDLKRVYMVLETVQTGALREQALVENDGQTLIDAAGNSILWGTNADASGNYSPPELEFTANNGDKFKPT